MAEKSSATAEGSSIFESLFGGFSNGLSIFTNNPFRRKNETTLSSREDASGERRNDDEFDGLSKMAVTDEVDVFGQEEAEDIGQNKRMKKTAALKAMLENIAEGDSTEEQEKGDVPTTKVPEEKVPESNLEKMKKVKRPDEEVVSEKKRRKTESLKDIADDENMNTGYGDSRKRKPQLAAADGVYVEEEAAGLDDITGTGPKKKMKKKGTESEQHQGLRQSARNMKKRFNEDLLFSTGISHKERKLEKTSAGIDEPEDLGGEKVLRPASKRGPQEADGGEEKQKKKMKRLEEIGPDSHVPKKGNEEDSVAGAPLLASAPAMETRAGSKRKMDSNVEDLYERKRRGTVDGKENVKVQQGDAEQGGVAATDLAERLRGKRKLSSEADGEDAVTGTKKKKTKEERIDNEERLKRTIFVGNLPVSLKPKQLLREFSQFGAVESARLRSVPLVDTKMPRKAAVITGQLNESRSSMNGFVVFHKEESAKAALAHNMTEFHGKHIRVDMATAPRKGDKIGESGIEYDRSRSIFVGNLPFDVEDEEVYSLFQGKTPDLEVEAVRVVRDPQTSIGKGFAFVCFKKKVGATTALDNAEFTRLRTRQLRIIRFGFQRKQTAGNLLAKTSSGKYRSKPRPGAEERISKRSVLSYEGTRASKADGRPGKATGPARTSHKGKSSEKGRSPKSGKGGNNSVPPKRPAVAARKLASQGNAVVPAGGKRKREEKGVLCLPPPPPVSTSAQLTGKLWSVVRSVGSYASSSFKDLLQDSETKSISVGGSMRKLLFNIEKRPETGTGATALRELSLVPSTRKIPSSRKTHRH